MTNRSVAGAPRVAEKDRGSEHLWDETRRNAAGLGCGAEAWAYFG